MCTRRLTYFAVLEPSKDEFGVYFPDLPGCVSYGKTFRDAQREAVDALGLHLYGMEQDGDPIPEPSQVPTVDPENVPGYFISPVTVYREWWS